jgi:hypothetical protein
MGLSSTLSCAEAKLQQHQEQQASLQQELGSERQLRMELEERIVHLTDQMQQREAVRARARARARGQ